MTGANSITIKKPVHDFAQQLAHAIFPIVMSLMHQPTYTAVCNMLEHWLCQLKKCSFTSSTVSISSVCRISCTTYTQHLFGVSYFVHSVFSASLPSVVFCVQRVFTDNIDVNLTVPISESYGVQAVLRLPSCRGRRCGKPFSSSSSKSESSDEDDKHEHGRRGPLKGNGRSRKAWM